MKLSKAEILSILLTAAFILSAALFIFLGKDGYTVSVAAVTPAPQSPVISEQEPLNINTADAKALDELPGIGQTLAERIIAYREENGGFAAISDITLVDGIGSDTFERIKHLITIK